MAHYIIDRGERIRHGYLFPETVFYPQTTVGLGAMLRYLSCNLEVTCSSCGNIYFACGISCPHVPTPDATVTGAFGFPFSFLTSGVSEDGYYLKSFLTSVMLGGIALQKEV